MTNILICGISGKMGSTVLELTQDDPEVKTVCGVDIRPTEKGVPVYESFSDVTEQVDVIVDFSSAVNLKERLAFAKRVGCGIVLAATGYSEADLALIDAYATEIAVFKTANLSIGINLLQALVKKAAAFLGETFDVEIIEKHHNLKKDAPSGTALMLAESVNEAFDGGKEYVYGREGIVGQRKRQELGIHAVRGGTIVGEHEVLFCGEDEIITISHSARSKRVFAAGAVKAAKWLTGKPAGKYDMSDVLTD